PLSDQLRRRRSWELYLRGPWALSDDTPTYVAVLAIRKKSRFTLEDARVALVIIAEEVVTRGGHLRGGGHLLVATQGEMAPVALTLLQSNDIAGRVTVGIRWGHLEDLVREGELSHFFDAVTAGRLDKGGQGSRPPFTPPAWLTEDQ
ncbi:unnamed protein product, partial [Choristocarpus tenellus]